jgi:hypothetical protein
VGTNHGTANNGATFSTSSKIGSHAGSFDGTNDYVSIPADPSLSFGTGDFTVSTWANFSDVSQKHGLLCSNGGANGALFTKSAWCLFIYAGSLNWYRYDGVTETSLNLGSFSKLNQWAHIVVSRTSGTLRAYINGSKDYDAANSIAYDDVDSNPLLVGLWSESGANQYFSGQIDDIAIWKGADSAPRRFEQSIP